MSTSNLPDEIRPEKELPKAIISLIHNQPIFLSDILEFDDEENEKEERNTEQQTLPLEVDLNKPFGIRNLSLKMESLLIESQLNRSDILSDPQAVIEMLSSYHEKPYSSKIVSKLLSTS